MTAIATGWTKGLDRPRAWSLPSACAALAVAILLALPLVGFAAQRSLSANGNLGTNVWASAAVAALVCLAAGEAALVASSLASGPTRGLQALGYGVLFMFAVPFGAGLVLINTVPWLAEAGVFGLIVVFYLVTLLAETWLVVRLVGGQVPGAGMQSAAQPAPRDGGVE